MSAPEARKLVATIADALPCPFCGKTEGLHQLEANVRSGTHNEVAIFYIQCKVCGAGGPLAYTRVAAIKQWNKRK